MYTDTWHLDGTVMNHYDPTFKPNSIGHKSSQLNVPVPDQLPGSPLNQFPAPSVELFNRMVNQIYTAASTIMAPYSDQPNQHETYSIPGYEHHHHHHHEQQQLQRQQQEQFFELFTKLFKNLPPKSDSPTNNLTKNPSDSDTVATAQDLSLTKYSDSKDMSLDLNNLSSSTWGTIPSPSDKPSPTSNQSDMLPDSKSCLSIKETLRLNLFGPDSLQRRQPFTHLNYPIGTSATLSTSPRKPRDFQLPDRWKSNLNSLGYVPTNHQPDQGQDWNSQFKALCDRLHCPSKSQANLFSLAHQSALQTDSNTSLWSAHYYSHMLRCQHYYEAYLNWFRLLGTNRLGHSDLENGKPWTSPPKSVSSGPKASFLHQPPTGSSACAPRLTSNPSCSTSMAVAKSNPNSIRTKRHSNLNEIKLELQLDTDCNPSLKHELAIDSPTRHVSSAVNLTDENQRFACKLCPKIYAQASALKMHVRTHTLPCRCSYCGKSFSRKWLLKGHERTHTGERPYGCPICSRSFADRSNLRAHMQTHQRDKRYSCPRCPRSFSRMGLLNKHMTQCTSSLSSKSSSASASSSGLASVSHLARALIHPIENKTAPVMTAHQNSTNRMKNRAGIL